MQHRIPLLDLIRSAAVLGMIAFHFSYDLVMFGVIPRDYAATPLFYYHARLVAGSFLLLAGLGLWLAHGQTMRWPAFWRRFGMVAAAAAAVSLATRIAMPDSYIYFGILHAIALFSVLGLVALRLPALATILLAAGFIAGSYLWKSEAFNAPLLRFLGLATEPAYTMDFEPVFPWFAATLFGIALGRIGTKTGLWQSLSRPATPLISMLSWPGRHSLLIYLIHQPILMSLVWAYTRL